MGNYREYILRTTGDGPPPLPVGDAMVLIPVPKGSAVVVLSDFDMKIVLPGLIAQLERKIPKPRSERSSWASIASIGVLPFLRRLANEGTDE